MSQQYEFRRPGLLEAVCLLHDTGVYPLYGADGNLLSDVNYITQGVEGETILKNEGFSGAICRFASHHIGMGLSRQDVIDQQLPLKDYLAETNEEFLAMYDDKFHSKTTPPYINRFEWYKRDIA